MQKFLKQTFSALKYPNYRLWFAGQLVSLVGTWMQTTAQGYLVYELTHSPAYLGYVGFAAGAPVWLFTLYGGVIADRVSRRNLMMITQTVMMVLALILASLTFLGVIQPWEIIVLAFGLGTANAFDVPSRQAITSELVNLEDLTNAIALNSSMFNMATVVGPAVSGLTYVALGPAWCFFINSLSFIAVIIALALMKLPPMPIRQRTTSAMTDIKEGIRYVMATPMLRTLITIPAMTSVFGMSYMTLIPAWSVNVLHGDATTNGLLLSARGLGALSAALMIASLGRFSFKGKLLTIGSFSFPILLLVFSEMRWLPLSLLALVGVGWGFMLIMNMANALVQTLVSDELRGRVMSIYMLGFFGLMPVGALMAGGVAELIGEPNTIFVSSLVSLLFAVYLWINVPKLRALP